ncbi:MAG: isoprenylcysteine carboxylmethyltransferase family protein [Gemmatales bacterium]|nr:isoprenylcysteine carboxylmethyltransferase family protein [Gemmatales bacterium]
MDDLAWELVCFLISLTGLAVRCVTVAHVPNGTSGRNTKSQEAKSLNTTGMYSITRNPLYFGNFLVGAGFSMFLRLWWVSFIYALAFWLYYERIIMAEEKFLLAKFGDAYRDYARRVPIFVPRLRLWQPPSLPCSIKAVVRREYSTLFMIVAVFTTLDVLTDFAVAHKFVFDRFWTTMLLINAVLYLLIRLV